ncbi:hypothetical protein TGME49_203800 [Toxoplasma gondii ME49]|uniref:HTH OST-type domain-containing protein n=1 Tax=Toxoplasma gondii (strain ATCC 50611 / Me49) TaxID=508771 RepID=S8F912_TOXGM|nr:hypothetical protein TGME49_203800 [Toxoplasma gondii ME49]EPT30088.1 hypothetical protein TGME49_203800 [Toxoplasma gondii ME49]|eukprot:XP_018637337.1 hypothetical protein TGME49_203800 [Toxoplasma gondii ME49]
MKMAGLTRSCGPPPDGDLVNAHHARDRFSWANRNNPDARLPRDYSTQTVEASTSEGANSSDGRRDDESKATTPTNKRVNWEHPYLGPDGVTYMPSISDASNPRATMIVSHSAAHPSYGPDPLLLKPEDIGFLKQAVTSLYADQIRPYQSEVVRRLKLLEPSTLVTKNALHFFRILTDTFIVEKTNHSRMVVYLKEKPAWFEGWIDPKSEEDPYPQPVWRELEQYLTVLSLVATILHELNDPKIVLPPYSSEETSNVDDSSHCENLPTSSLAMVPFTANLFRKLRKLLRQARQQDQGQCFVAASDGATKLSTEALEEQTRPLPLAIGSRSAYLEKACQQARLTRPPLSAESDMQAGSPTRTPDATPTHSPAEGFCSSPPSSPLSQKQQDVELAPPVTAIFSSSPKFFLTLAVAADETVRFVTGSESLSYSPYSDMLPSVGGKRNPLNDMLVNHEARQEEVCSQVEESRSSTLDKEPAGPSESQIKPKLPLLTDRQVRQEQGISVLIQSVLLEACHSWTQTDEVESACQHHGDANRSSTSSFHREKENEYESLEAGKQKVEAKRVATVPKHEDTESERNAAPTIQRMKPKPAQTPSTAPVVSTFPVGTEKSETWRIEVTQTSTDATLEGGSKEHFDEHLSRPFESLNVHHVDRAGQRHTVGMRSGCGELERAPTSLSSPCSTPASPMSKTPVAGLRSVAAPQPNCRDLSSATAAALPLARAVALRVRAALAKGITPDHFGGGRYGCALSLKRHGPVSVRSFTLGCLCHLVQLSVSRSFLHYVGGLLQPCGSGFSPTSLHPRPNGESLAQHATVAAIAAAALAYLELLLQGEVPQGIEGLEGGEESDLAGSTLPPYLRLGEEIHGNQPPFNHGHAWAKDDSAESQTRSARTKGLTKIKTMAELRRLITNVLACNQRAVLLSQLRGKLVDMYGATLTPSTFHYYKLSDLLLCELGDICSIWCHGDRQLVVHDAAYQPDPSSCSPGQRPTKITAFSLSRPPSLPSGLHHNASSPHRQQLYQGRERGLGGLGDQRFKLCSSHPALPSLVSVSSGTQQDGSTISEVNEALRRLRETRQQSRGDMGRRLSPGDRRHPFPDRYSAQGRHVYSGESPSRLDVPTLPRLSLPRPRLQYDNQVREDMPTASLASDAPKYEEALAGDLLHMQLLQLQQQHLGPDMNEHEPAQPLSVLSRSSRFLSPSSPCLFPPHLPKQVPEKGASASAGFLSSYASTQNRDCAGSDRIFVPDGNSGTVQELPGHSVTTDHESPATQSLLSASLLLLDGLAGLMREASSELEDNGAKFDIPDTRVRAEVTASLPQLHARCHELESPTRHVQSRSYTALPLSPSLRPIVAPPENIQCRWNSNLSNDFDGSVGRAASQPALWSQYDFDRSDILLPALGAEEDAKCRFANESPSRTLRSSGGADPSMPWSASYPPEDSDVDQFDFNATKTSYCLHLPPRRPGDELATSNVQQHFA